MFLMTGNISFGNPDDSTDTRFKCKFNSCEWRHSVADICSTAEIKLPSRAFINKKALDTDTIIKPGKMVKIECGYDGNNNLQFAGFVVKCVKSSGMTKVFCEGYSYQLRHKGFSKSYSNPSLKTILNDIIKGTGVKLSKDIQEITFKGSFVFKTNAFDVLKYLQEKCLLTVYFYHQTLYVGLKYVQVGKEIKYRLNWNVINDEDLVISEPIANPKQYILKNRNNDGSKTIVTAGEGTIVKVNVHHISDKTILQALASEMKKESEGRIYQGSLKTLLLPFARPADTALISSFKAADKREGKKETFDKYFIESVGGSFSDKGGRQTIGIAIKLS